MSNTLLIGQQHNDDLGLIYYNARYYLPGVGRFVNADTIVPDATNPQFFNRYAYVLNSPLTLIDPSGHRPSDGCDYEGCLSDPDSWGSNFIDYLIQNTEFSNPNDNPIGQIIIRQFSFILPLGMEDGASANAIVTESITGAMSFINHGVNGLYPIADMAELLTVSGALIYAMEADLGEKADGVGGFGGGGINSLGANGNTCLNCGTHQPDLVRRTGRLRVDEDGASVFCRNCVRNGDTPLPQTERNWIHSYDDYVQLADDLRVGRPVYTEQYGPGHFSVFAGAGNSGNVFDRLNMWIRSLGKSTP